MDVKYIHEDEEHNIRAAEVVVPILMNYLKPKSVLDVGCGIGTWLHVFAKNGVSVIHGLDGDYVDRSMLTRYIKESDFTGHDLAKPFNLNKKFDLVISLEVAEHLPDQSADEFVSSLTKHGETILFSAAVPGQHGQNHINEQWPAYWAQKFNAHGFKAYDLIRPLVWNNQGVDIWYRQNMLLFSQQPFALPEAGMLNIIIPEYWEKRMEKIRSLEHQLSRIRAGKVGVGFYIKSFFKSLAYFGKKTP